MLADVSRPAPDQTWLLLGQATIAAAVTVILALIQYRTQVVLKTQAAEVKSDLHVATKTTDKKLSEMAKVAESTHILVNGNMSAQLKNLALVTARLAQVTGDQNDRDIAEAAAKTYLDHERGQKAVETAKTEGAELSGIILKGQPPEMLTKIVLTSEQKAEAKGDIHQ